MTRVAPRASQTESPSPEAGAPKSKAKPEADGCKAEAGASQPGSSGRKPRVVRLADRVNSIHPFFSFPNEPLVFDLVPASFLGSQAFIEIVSEARRRHVVIRVADRSQPLDAARRWSSSKLLNPLKTPADPKTGKPEAVEALKGSPGEMTPVLYFEVCPDPSGSHPTSGF